MSRTPTPTIPTQKNINIKEYYTNECCTKILNNNKNKSNVVGVGVPDDPKEKLKNTNTPMSNVPTSNSQRPTSNAAITLVALVITIIVLLILAGVTLSIVMGDSGIFGKANKAKNKTEVAQYEEELRMCILELQTDSATNGVTFNMETIKDKLVKKVKEMENTDDIEFPTKENETRLDGIYKGYEFYIDEKYAAHIGEKSTGISLTTSLEPSGWTNKNVTATITIKSNNGINKVEPDEGIKNGANEYVITRANITENTSFKYTVTDGQGNTQEKTAEINTIDKETPADFTITAEKIGNGLKINGETTDTESGIDRYEYYAKKSTDGEYTIKYESNLITGLTRGTYDIKVIAYDKAGNQTRAEITNIRIAQTYTGVTAQMVANEPSKYYGLKVTNYTAQNGQNDWRIFYSDGTHVFLITGDFANASETKATTGMTTLNYSAYWASVPKFQTVDSSTLTRFKAKEYVLKEGIDNSKCVSTLLNSNNWSNYKDSGNKAEKAIGSPTVEMWMDSWNARYPKDKLYCNNTNSNGYYVGTDSKPNSTYIDKSVMNKKEGYNNKLYYPHQADYNASCYRYWLASPSAYGGGNILYIGKTGIVHYTPCSDKVTGVRPVVSLNSEITVDAEEVE